MRIVASLGGGTLTHGAESLTAVAAEHQFVLTHDSAREMAPLSLALRNAMPERDVVTLLPEVVVTEDAALAVIGGRGGEAQQLPPSPEPRAIVDLRSLRTLLDAGAIVIYAGGAGSPVIVNGSGRMHGVEAVVDMDLTASLLARRLDADLFLMLTDVDVVRLGWGSDRESLLRNATPAMLREHDFESGSMGPKVEAACRFVESTGRPAAIGALRDVVGIVRGEAGTQIAAHLA